MINNLRRSANDNNDTFIMKMRVSVATGDRIACLAMTVIAAWYSATRAKTWRNSAVVFYSPVLP